MPRRPHARVVLLALAAACPAVVASAAEKPAICATTQPAGLPVRGITLYTSGVGFFRHDGRFTGDGRVTLKFKTGQINDVIKSLVVQDDGGRVLGVQYPSQDPLDKTLKTFQIDLSSDPSMADLLSQLRGAKVTVTAGGEKQSGTIVGVDTRKKNEGDKTVIETTVLNLFNGSSLSQVETDKINALQLDDPALAAELAQALAAVAAGRDQDKKPVTIQFTGSGEHRLRVGYVVETPVWKTAYRLLLNDKADGSDATTKAASGDQLQGWAVVENQTDSDWNDISLDLVSGRPISFVMDLYQPLYLTRPTVELSLFRGLRPQVYQEGMQNRAFGVGGRVEAAKRMSAAPAAATPALHDFDGDGAADMSLQSRFDQISTPAVTAKLGALFKFTIEHVSLPRQQSSLVPIVTDSVTAEPLSIYNETVLPRNPLNGVMLTNTTGKLLPQGPLTVFDHGTYAGDAQIEDLPAGEKRMLSYGVDLQTLVDVKADQTNDQVGGKIVKGVLFISRRQVQTKTYTVENKSDAARTVIVEHPLLDGWSLTDTAEPMEKTDRRYRFKLDVKPQKSEPLKVTQQRVYAEGVALLDGDLNGLLFQAREGALPPKVKAAVAEAMSKRQAVIDLERQSGEKNEAINAIGSEQQRLRENMKVVDKTTDYYGRLMGKLNEQESKIETLQKERDDLNEKAKTARQAFTDYLANLNVE